jgi:hypothetical protein
MASNHRRAFTGRSGQSAVVAELLNQGCNAAIPEVDVGQDVFAFRDDDEVIARLQVKTANARPLKRGGFTAQFSVPLAQVTGPDRPPLHYVFAVRYLGRWEEFLIISRPELRELRRGQNLGSVFVAEGAEHLKIVVSFREAETRAGTVDLAAYRSAWESLPPLRAGPSTPRGGSTV